MGITDLKNGKPLSREESERPSNKSLSESGITFEIRGDYVEVSVSEEIHRKVKADAERQGKTVAELLQEKWQVHAEEVMGKYRREQKKPN
jgi:geranylgeranyl pyrophosphate synthase